ncbi:MAG: hypothetical protein HYY18_05600 [Planctomycetes bacterium]|nr:hypothetical protein [Planctomycetota bacterium]
MADGVENPHNALTLLHAAKLFACPCLFRDTKGLASAWSGAALDAQPLPVLPDEISLDEWNPLVALENSPGARDIYGYRLPAGETPALVVGNERFGISARVLARAQQTVQIPMHSTGLNTINVAAAAGVALYYICRGGGSPTTARRDPGKRRPEVALIAPGDHFELGSSIRSAAAFGWSRLLLEDSNCVWFGVDRATRSEGRGAARRSRNSIRVIPAREGWSAGFSEVCVVTTTGPGVPLHRADLAGGPRQLLAIPDESDSVAAAQDWSRLGAVVKPVHLDLPGGTHPYHYRLIASIVLAEAARQVGRRPHERGPAASPEPIYQRALKLVDAAGGEPVSHEELRRF